MSSRFVRTSKYRHVFGTASKRDQCYDNLRTSRNAWDTNLVKANPLFISVNLEASGGGSFAILPHASTGKAADTMPVVNGHMGAVLDTDFHPFNDHIIASASEDTKVMVWTIPEGGLARESLSIPTLTLTGHGRKVGHVLFHPSAENVLASSSADFTIKIWDIAHGTEKVELRGHGDIILSMDWNPDGSLLATTCKDKKVRIFDVRANKMVQEASGHQGVKGARLTWCGPSTSHFITTGFSRSSDRQVYVWDQKSFREPFKQENIDTASGMLIPYFDADTSVLFLAGKGDGNIRYYELDESGLHYLSEYKSSEPQRGISFLPKRALNVADVEVARAYKVTPTMVEPISFRVPRKSDAFQSDLFPDCIADEPALTVDEYFAGETALPKRMSMEKGFTSVVKEFVTTAAAPDHHPVDKGPSTEKEYQDAYHAARKENDDLKHQLAQRDAKIRQLEAQLQTLLA